VEGQEKNERSKMAIQIMIAVSLIRVFSIDIRPIKHTLSTSPSLGLTPILECFWFLTKPVRRGLQKLGRSLQFLRLIGLPLTFFTDGSRVL
jgi:hypothetical protein